MAKLKSGTRIYGTATIDTSVVVGSAVTVSSSGLQVTGNSLITGISTVANLRITPVGTGATVGGIGVTYYGDGSQLTGISAGVSISTNTTNANQYIPYATSFGSTTGFGATTLLVYNPSSGNLGIGTTNPTSKLRVIGDALVSGVVTATTFIGALSGTATTATSISSDSDNNTKGGTGAGSSLVAGSGTNNTFFGFSAGCRVTTGDYNIALGSCALLGNSLGVTGNYNFVVGFCAGALLTNGYYNNFLGYFAGYFNTTGSYNNFFGNNAGLCNNTGSNNNFFGNCAGYRNTTGGCNNFLGSNAGYFNTTGSYNNFFGNGTGFNNLNGSGNNFFGNCAGNLNTTGSNNNFFGSFAGTFNDSGSDNIFLGQSAGSTNVTGSQNIAIGYNQQTPITSGSNQLVIGAGNTAWITGNRSYNVGFGTTNPTSKLHVVGDARVTGAIYDSSGNSGTNGQVLQSISNGTATQWTTAAAGGGSGKFDTTIDNVLYIQPTGTLDIVGVGTTTSQITTLPSGSNKYLVHSIHVTNISNGDAEITAGFIINSKSVPASISVSAGSSGGAGIHTFTVGSASSITVGMAVTGTGNIGETTGIGSTAGFQYNTYVTSVDGNTITLSKPMSGRATGVLYFSPVSKVSSRLPVPVGSAVELLKQPMVLNALDSIVLQSTGAGTGIGSTSTAAITQTANSNFLTVTAGAAITNFLTSGMLVQGIGTNTGIQTNTFVGVGYTPGSLSVPMTRPATSTLSSQILSFTEVVVPEDGALQVTVVYQSSTDTAYLNGTGTVVGIVTTTPTTPGVTSTTPSVYYATGNTYPSIIQSIRVTNISDGTIYPGGDYPVSVGIGNSDTVFSWLAYNMVIPKNSSIELCEAPKRIGIGQSVFASSPIPGVIEIQVAGKQKTS